MILKLIYFLIFLLFEGAYSANNGFTFNGNFELGGIAEVRPDGLFRLTNPTRFSVGHAFFTLPFRLKNLSDGDDAFSFSTSFVFAIVPDKLPGHGMAFAISPSKNIPGGAPAQHLGLFNRTNNGDPSNHLVAIELDTFRNQEFQDIDNNHVGIDINSIVSVNSSTAGYFTDGNGDFKNIHLASGDPILAWVDYDGVKKQLNITLVPVDIADKPQKPLLSVGIDISPYILDDMYVGFSSSTGQLLQTSYILGWSFQVNGKAEELDLAKLPSLPRRRSKKKKVILATVLPILGLVSVLASILLVVSLRRRSRFAEVLEDWEVQYGPHRFPYKDLYIATKGFQKKELLGRGGFGEVYRGILPVSKTLIAVKRISHNSRQGMKEFVAEIATIGRLRHPNLVRLQGYCRRKGELFLVYDYMPNASLDKFLFRKAEQSLNWDQRFKIIKDVASALAYLHEEWVEVIIHRDIKASNVLLDGNLNGKLGDFGLARSIDPGKDLQTTHVAGTLGYIAPELARNGKATTSTDVFAFGAFCLEVACGRKPVEPRAIPEEVLLVDWVAECWRRGEILTAADPKLNKEFESEQMELVLMLGLVCSHHVAEVRPRMSRVLLYLKGHASLSEDMNEFQGLENWKELNSLCYPNQTASVKEETRPSLTITEMFVSEGR